MIVLYLSSLVFYNVMYCPTVSEDLLLIIIVGTPPINPGSIPSVGMNSHSVANRTSIGGGVAPTNFAQVRHYVLVNCFSSR